MTISSLPLILPVNISISPNPSDTFLSHLRLGSFRSLQHLPFRRVLILASVSAFHVSAQITEFDLAWRGNQSSSTHEIVVDPSADDTMWVTGQNFDAVARVSTAGVIQHFPLPAGSGPHGILFDGNGDLWVSLEFSGSVVRMDRSGDILETIDVRIEALGSVMPINPSPHGIGLGSDGETIWFTGKRTGTVGRINPDRSVEHFELPTIGSVSIYLVSGPDGNMWCTELVGNKIARISPAGVVTEFSIPTHNSRPIAIVPGPDGKSMWFSQEAGRAVARIGLDGVITELKVPLPQENMILAGLTFDNFGNLWTQGYVDSNDPLPEGPDFIIKIDKSVNITLSNNLANTPIEFFEIPTRNTIMHRIVQGPDGNIWFTELGTNKLGKLAFIDQLPTTEGLSLSYSFPQGSTLGWWGLPNKSYQVEYSENLITWFTDLPDSSIGSGPLIKPMSYRDSDAVQHPRRFYRLAVEGLD